MYLNHNTRNRTSPLLLTCLSIVLLGLPLQIRALDPPEKETKADAATAVDTILAETPPMGWNSWNHFRCNINQQIVKGMADAMVESGMKEAGYEYIVIDDCWMASERDENGQLQPHSERFPDGIKAVADYVHSKGLKFGIYQAAATTTCQDYPGSLNHEQQDAKTFAKWGVDYLKYDNCSGHLGIGYRTRYRRMHEALESTGRDIVYSVATAGYYRPWRWARDVGGNLWRTTGDIGDCFTRPGCDEDIEHWRWTVTEIVDIQVGLAKYAGPGGWNDPDMLEVGNGGMTATEYRAHFSMWAMMAAPLMAGNDLREMSETTVNILTNEEVIAVDQDPLGMPAEKIRDDGEQEVWARPLKGGDYAVVLFNRDEQNHYMTTSVETIGMTPAKEYRLNNLWSDEAYVTTGRIHAEVEGHGVVMYRVSRMAP